MVMEADQEPLIYKPGQSSTSSTETTLPRFPRAISIIRTTGDHDVVMIGEMPGALDADAGAWIDRCTRED